MNTSKLAGEVAEVKGGSKGIRAAVARLIRRRSVIDIVQRFQTQHALQEEREMKNYHSLTNGVIGTTRGGTSHSGSLFMIARRKQAEKER